MPGIRADVILDRLTHNAYWVKSKLLKKPLTGFPAFVSLN